MIYYCWLHNQNVQPFFLFLLGSLYLSSAGTAQKRPNMHNAIVLSDLNLFATIQRVMWIKASIVAPDRNSYGDYNRLLAQTYRTLVTECEKKQL